MINHILELPDGFNGHTIKCYSNPIEVDGNTVKLQCAEEEKEYMFKWTTWNNRFEALTHLFYQKTGFLAPGKAECEITDQVERRKLWTEFITGIKFDV
jgi:hypothetical protein